MLFQASVPPVLETHDWASAVWRATEERSSEENSTSLRLIVRLLSAGDWIAVMSAFVSSVPCSVALPDAASMMRAPAGPAGVTVAALPEASASDGTSTKTVSGSVSSYSAHWGTETSSVVLSIRLSEEWPIAD
eukprot:5599207-Prymnesium_polylepis.1